MTAVLLLMCFPTYEVIAKLAALVHSNGHFLLGEIAGHFFSCGSSRDPVFSSFRYFIDFREYLMILELNFIFSSRSSISSFLKGSYMNITFPPLMIKKAHQNTNIVQIEDFKSVDACSSHSIDTCCHRRSQKSGCKFYSLHFSS